MASNLLLTMTSIRKYNPDNDYAGLRECIVELQDYEYEIDDRFPDGESIVDAYIPDIIRRSEMYRGDIFVAELGGEIAGYVMVWTQYETGDIEDGGFVCGLLADLAVLERHRGKGMGRELIEFAEEYARKNGVRYLRLGVMARNYAARQVYERLKYHEAKIELEKDLGTSE